MEIVTEEVRKAREHQQRVQAYREHQKRLIKTIDEYMKKDPMPGASINICKRIRRNIQRSIKPVRKSKELASVMEYNTHAHYLAKVNLALKFKREIYFKLCQYQPGFRWSRYETTTRA